MPPSMPSATPPMVSTLPTRSPSTPGSAIRRRVGVPGSASSSGIQPYECDALRSSALMHYENRTSVLKRTLAYSVVSAFLVGLIVTEPFERVKILLKWPSAAPILIFSIKMVLAVLCLFIFFEFINVSILVSLDNYHLPWPSSLSS